MANPIQLMIYIDASRYSNTEKRTGVENYSFYLINELVKGYKKEITLISPRRINLRIPQIIIPFPRLWTLLRLSWEIFRNKKINNLFVPSHVLPLIHPKHSVITIHDVVFRYSPKSYSRASRIYLNWATKYAVKHAAKIITPSEATRQDLIRFYKADPQKITVIPLGFSPSLSQNSASSVLTDLHLKPKEYFLFIGRIEYKKNTDTLIRAFADFAKQDDKIKLVLAGFPGHGGKKIIEAIPASIKERVILSGYVEEAEKSALLKNSLSFVFPSRFEGFGIPLLEAMRAKVPIIASDIPSSKEVAGNSIRYFDKEDPEALAKLMKEMVSSPEINERAYEERLQRFSWRVCAKSTYEAIKTPKGFTQNCLIVKI